MLCLDSGRGEVAIMQQYARHQERRISQTPQDVRNRLGDTGLMLTERIVQAIARTLQERIILQGTGYPRGAIGIHSWAKCIQGLRDASFEDVQSTALSTAYSAKQDHRMELLVSADDRRIVKVHAGNAGAGDPDNMNPSNSRRLGAGTSNLHRQWALPTFERELWVLLTRWEPTGFFGELMHVASISSSGFIDDWHERIMLNAYMLPPIQFDDQMDEDEGFAVPMKLP